MKKLFRAAYGDESRVMLILADNLDEAISLANKNEADLEYPYFFDEDSVFEIDLNIESQIIENITIDNFI